MHSKQTEEFWGSFSFEVLRVLELEASWFRAHAAEL